MQPSFAATARMQKDLRDLLRSPPPGITAWLVDGKKLDQVGHGCGRYPL